MFVAGGAPAGPPRRPLPVYGNVTYDDVSFAYESSRPVLRHVSFKLLAGTSAAIIGPSGAGKTTLLNLLPRFFDPESGAVLLEGVDLRDLRLEDLRAQVALVLQEPIILPTTVAENISYGKPQRDHGRRSRRPRAPPMPTSSSRSCPSNTKRSSATAGRA